MSKLFQLPKGSKAIVTGITAEGITRRRLMDLGFVEGSSVTVVRSSPLGDPTAYIIRGAIIALRREEAAWIETTAPEVFP